MNHNVYVDLSDKTQIVSTLNNCRFKRVKSDKLVFENILVDIENEFIKTYSLQDCSFLWEINFNSLLKSKNSKSFGRYLTCKNLVAFTLMDRDESKAGIFILDSNTGDLVKKYDNEWGYLQLFGDKIYFLREKEVQVINTDTFELVRIDLTEELQVLDQQIEQFVETGESLGMSIREFNFSIDRYFIKDNLLYFVQERGSQTGIINLQTKKLEWYTDIKVDNDVNPVLRDVKANDSHVYVLDNADTLHIFEKEEQFS